MEKVLDNGFCEMSQEEVMTTDGGGVLDLVTNFLTGRLIWSNAKHMIDNVLNPPLIA